MKRAPGRRFLNLFAYTGTATVYAAAGGAASTTPVDLSANYLDWARRNLELNGLEGPQHRFIRADCLVWLEERGHARRGAAGLGLAGAPCRAGPPRSAGDGDGPYDLIFLDAPTFSNSKSMEGTSTSSGTTPACPDRRHLLSPEGILLFSTNFRRFKLAGLAPGIRRARHHQKDNAARF